VICLAILNTLVHPSIHIKELHYIYGCSPPQPSDKGRVTSTSPRFGYELFEIQRAQRFRREESDGIMVDIAEWNADFREVE
jgi:hypothetical protein